MRRFSKYRKTGVCLRQRDLRVLTPSGGLNCSFPRISFGGKPADLTVRRSLEASEWMVNLIVRFVGWLYYGNLQRFGFEKPPLPSRVDIAVNGSFVETLASGKVLVRSKLAKVIGPKVVEFRDGATLDGIDDIIMATGYRPEHSFRKSPVAPRSSLI